MSTIEKIKKSRQKNVTIDGHRITIRRPTPVEFYECPLSWLAGRPANLDDDAAKKWVAQQIDLRSPDWRAAAWHMVTRFVDDWDLQEIDLIPGGTGIPEPFAVEVLTAWLQDRPDALNELALAIFNEAFIHQQAMADAEKKLQTGSNPETSPS